MKKDALIIKGSCRLWGEQFSPHEAEKITGFQFDHKNEPGDISNIGRYKGRPLPYGSARMEFEGAGTSADLLSSDAPVFDILDRHFSSFQSCGAKEVVLHLDVFYEEQCNLEFSHELLRRLAGFDITLTVSCHQLVDT